ncbi:sulfurtransferase [Cellulomonas endometrii]|uniref:sulfurtransferase n=1 Tax=Cellulomonas endometrii TaxID=3036301 RepID=UPI0024AE1971|nr:sulfurtransferase [Cellulomonas endometrii]
MTPGPPASPHLAPVVGADWLAQHAADPDLVLADVRWYLDGRSGRAAYDAGHLPGAVFVDLDAWLAGDPGAGRGRNPLPEPAVFARGMSVLGIGDASTVLAYDDAGGVIAARLVWMLRALGREAALLDGGLLSPDVLAVAGPVTTAVAPCPEASFTAQPWPAELLADLGDVAPGSRAAGTVVVDARPADRFRGAVADVDVRAGHVPGAVNVPCREHLDASGRLVGVPRLRDRFDAAGATADAVAAGRVVVMCGSGVTACHDLLAMELAGLGRARLHPGSWSQYAATSLPVATGG